MSNTQTVREAIIKGYKEDESFTAPGIALITAGKVTATQVGVSLASIEKDNLPPYITKSGFQPQKNGRSLRIWQRLRTRRLVAKVKPAEPELDYAQIGKAIIERIQQLDTLANEGIEFRSVAAILEGRIVKLRAHEEEQSTIIKNLNVKITDLNEKLRQAKLDRSKVNGGTFKLGDIARIS